MPPGALGDRGGLPFYIYPEVAFDQSAALECHPGWLYDDQAAEVAMLKLLRSHPARVHTPEAAKLFVVPIMPYVSSAAGLCHGETHDKRMSRAATALRNSPWLKRRQGHDHLLVTNTFRVKLFGASLKPLLTNATVAWFEQPRLPGGARAKGVLFSLAFWRCTVVIPYLANPFCAQQREVAPEEGEGRRKGSVFFQGSWAAAANLRRRFSALQDLPGAQVHDVPRGCHADNASLPACLASRLQGTRLHTARGMLSHQFCLVPRGDTPSSGRLFGALACRCVPLVLSNKFEQHYPFREVGRYDEWALPIAEGEFMREPRAAVERAMERARPKLHAIRAAMDAVSPELLYDHPQSRAADNLLRGVEVCSAVSAPAHGHASDQQATGQSGSRRNRRST
jgi:hypothetical protein